VLSYEIKLGNKTAKELVDRNGRQLHDANRAPINIPPGESFDVNVGNGYPDYSSTLEGMLHGNAPRICNIRIHGSRTKQAGRGTPLCDTIRRRAPYRFRKMVLLTNKGELEMQ